MPVRKILSKTELSLQPTVEVTDFDDVYVKKAVQDLLDTLAHHQLELDQKYPGKGMGVGLASNQIEYPLGDYPATYVPPNLYVVSIRSERAKIESCPPLPPSVYINATFAPVANQDLKPHQNKILYEEGCLSVTGIKGLSVPRFNKIKLKAWDQFGKEINIAVEGFTARVHQHEIDHGLGEEYLNRMEFSLEELHLIKRWIEQSKLGKIQFPCPIISNRLECIDSKPDINALEVWLRNEIKKKELKNLLDSNKILLLNSRPKPKEITDGPRLKSRL